jgi:3-phenylpropionate/trans-cinnamate dioxygenase ferredoxin reductase subunit
VILAQDAGLLVVGAGQAAVQLACSLREGGYDGQVTLVGEEATLPYQRPPLSKSFLKGAADVESLAFRTPDFYRDNRITLVTGERVEHLDLRSDGSGTASCASGLLFHFSRLVLATGARARQLPIEGADAQGVHTLRDVADALRLRTDLARADDVAVLGGGFVGLEVAATARKLGRSVTVLEAGPSLLGRAVGPVTAEFVHAAHARAGVRIRLDASAKRLLVRTGRVSGVETCDGVRVAAQLVVVGVGARPRTNLAERAGLLCRDGVLVDERGLASDGVTLAIGDCASVPDRSDPTVRRRLESVENAVTQARTVAATILGTPAPVQGVPWFWSDQGSLKLQIAGLSQGADDCVVRRYPDDAKLTVVFYRSGRMLAAETVNAPADALAVRRALEQGLSFDAEDVADCKLPFRSLLARPAAVIG